MPWPNRIRAALHLCRRGSPTHPQRSALGNASHGLANWARWIVDEHRPDEVRLHCDVVAQKGWPCELRAEVSYRVDADAGLTVTLGATNMGVDAVPFGAGSHPYLSAGDTPIDEVQLRVPGRTRLVTDDAQIPIRGEGVAGTEFDLRELGTYWDPPFRHRLHRLDLDPAPRPRQRRTPRGRAGDPTVVGPPGVHHRPGLHPSRTRAGPGGGSGRAHDLPGRRVQLRRRV